MRERIGSFWAQTSIEGRHLGSGGPMPNKPARNTLLTDSVES
jgi:hypothetical protein